MESPGNGPNGDEMAMLGFLFHVSSLRAALIA
jgi:hypothetical protein